MGLMLAVARVSCHNDVECESAPSRLVTIGIRMRREGGRERERGAGDPASLVASRLESLSLSHTHTLTTDGETVRGAGATSDADAFSRSLAARLLLKKPANA